MLTIVNNDNGDMVNLIIMRVNFRQKSVYRNTLKNVLNIYRNTFIICSYTISSRGKGRRTKKNY